MDEQKQYFIKSLDPLSPLDPPRAGSLLYSIRSHHEPSELLLQQRDGIWFSRNISDKDQPWEAQEHFVEWAFIWRQYSPVFHISIEDAPVESLDEFAEISVWISDDIDPIS